LSGTALRVLAVAPAAAALRHTAAFPPLPHPLAGGAAGGAAGAAVPRCLEPLEVLVQLEGSGAPRQAPSASLGRLLKRALPGIPWRGRADRAPHAERAAPCFGADADLRRGRARRRRP